jgi:hypothetical protein
MPLTRQAAHQYKQSCEPDRPSRQPCDESAKLARLETKCSEQPPAGRDEQQLRKRQHNSGYQIAHRSTLSSHCRAIALGADFADGHEQTIAGINRRLMTCSFIAVTSTAVFLQSVRDDFVNLAPQYAPAAACDVISLTHKFLAIRRSTRVQLLM